MTEEEKRKKFPAAVYSRIVGYISPVNIWNEGKKQEYADRRDFKLPGIKE